MKKYEVSLSLFTTVPIFATLQVQAEDEEMAEIAALQALEIEVKGVEEVSAIEEVGQ
jgi:hypothetical protein